MDVILHYNKARGILAIWCVWLPLSYRVMPCGLNGVMCRSPIGCCRFVVSVRCLGLPLLSFLLLPSRSTFFLLFVCQPVPSRSPCRASTWFPGGVFFPAGGLQPVAGRRFIWSDVLCRSLFIISCVFVCRDVLFWRVCVASDTLFSFFFWARFCRRAVHVRDGNVSISWQCYASMYSGGATMGANRCGRPGSRPEVKTTPC